VPFQGHRIWENFPIQVVPLADYKILGRCASAASILILVPLLVVIGNVVKHKVAIPRISPETLAEMVGKTRSRVSFVMNRV